MANNIITLEAAVKMTTLYREQKDIILAAPYQGLNILPICETFGKNSFERLVHETDCQSIRIYYGMSEDLKMHAVVVGVNSQNEDILPSEGTAREGDDDPVILEEATRCPDDCPPPSPLNP